MPVADWLQQHFDGSNVQQQVKPLYSHQPVPLKSWERELKLKRTHHLWSDFDIHRATEKAIFAHTQILHNCCTVSGLAAAAAAEKRSGLQEFSGIWVLLLIAVAAAVTAVFCCLFFFIPSLTLSLSLLQNLCCNLWKTCRCTLAHKGTRTRATVVFAAAAAAIPFGVISATCYLLLLLLPLMLLLLPRPPPPPPPRPAPVVVVVVVIVYGKKEQRDWPPIFVWYQQPAWVLWLFTSLSFESLPPLSLLKLSSTSKQQAFSLCFRGKRSSL